MIRINLLAEGKRPSAVRKTTTAQPLLEREDIGVWFLLGALLLTGLMAGGYWFKVHGDLEAKKAAVAEAERKKKELEEVLKQVEEFKAKKAELEHKIEVINELKLNQRGPVRVMDYISESLPELLWIDTMNMRPDTITLTGRAFNINAVANFIESLDEVSEFREPTRSDIQEQGTVYRYVINFNYTYTPIAGPTETAEDETVATAAGG